MIEAATVLFFFAPHYPARLLPFEPVKLTVHILKIILRKTRDHAQLGLSPAGVAVVEWNGSPIRFLYLRRVKVAAQDTWPLRGVSESFVYTLECFDLDPPMRNTSRKMCVVDLDFTPGTITITESTRSGQGMSKAVGGSGLIGHRDAVRTAYFRPPTSTSRSSARSKLEMTRYPLSSSLPRHKGMVVDVISCKAMI